MTVSKKITCEITLTDIILGVVVEFQTVQYWVDEGSVVSITVLTDKPIYNNYSVLLTTFINSSLHTASGVYIYFMSACRM